MNDPDTITARRRDAEEGGSDAELLALRSLERAGEVLPPIIDGVRRSTLLWADPIAATWTGWDIEGGGQVLLRCLRVEWRDDQVMRRRMARAARSLPALRTPSWHPDGDWPHLRIDLGGPLLRDAMPAAEAPHRIAGVLTRALAGLAALHGAGAHLGGRLEEHLVMTREGPEMLWLDRFDAPGSPEDDLRTLGALAETLSPDGRDPLAGMVRDWTEVPPPTALDGAHLLRRAMSQALLNHRHRLRRLHQNNAHLSEVYRLRRLVERLAKWPPPTGAVCLSANDPQAPVLLHSDGARVTHPAEDAVVYCPESGLDPRAHRSVARAWRRRSPSMEPTRLSVQAGLGSRPGDAEALIRWLKARAELRTLRLLMPKATR